MKSLILAFANDGTCRNIRSLLESSGISVRKECYSGAEVLREASKLDSGIVICGFKLQDMTADVLNGMLPSGYVMLMLASSQQIAFCESTDVLHLTTPVNKIDLMSTIRTMQQMQKLAAKKHKDEMIAAKSNQDLPIIERAKGMLMIQNNMTEEEAHRLLQKRSMNSGCKMIDIAKIVLNENM